MAHAQARHDPGVVVSVMRSPDGAVPRTAASAAGCAVGRKRWREAGSAVSALVRACSSTTPLVYSRPRAMITTSPGAVLAGAAGPAPPIRSAASPIRCAAAPLTPCVTEVLLLPGPCSPGVSDSNQRPDSATTDFGPDE